MSGDNHRFVAWEEHIISQEKGNRIVHYYLKDLFGDLVLAVVGTERSLRHMVYVFSDDFIKCCGSNRAISASKKWLAKREVVNWLTSFVMKNCSASAISYSKPWSESLGSQEISMSNLWTHLPDQKNQIPRKLKVQISNIVWSGDAWYCLKQLKHYPRFRRSGTTIAVHSFVFILAEEGGHYLSYLEDLYEDKKRQKKAKVRWFHHDKEVNVVISQLNPHPKEVFITPHVQVISADCIDGPATVLTPKHYEKYLSVVSQTSSFGIHMCFRQIKYNKVEPFSLSKLRGYSNQVIFSSLGCPLVFKLKSKRKRLGGVEEDEFTHKDLSTRGHQQLESGNSGTTNSVREDKIAKSQPTYKKLRIKLSTKGTVGLKLVGPEVQCRTSSKVNENIELLCQDSGIRGCWFRCTVLQTSGKHLKVQYHDVEDVDGSGNLEEWVPAPRVAAPDKLGMRCSGRLTIRPWPPEDLSEYSFEVGAPVDAWWSNGWWEGVVTRLDKTGSDDYILVRCLYLAVVIDLLCNFVSLGEHKVLEIQRKDMRISRDWVDNQWVHVKAKPDVLSFISSAITPNLKLQTCASLGEEPECGRSALVNGRLITTVKLESIDEDTIEFPGSLKKRFPIKDDKYLGSGDDASGNKAKSVSKEGFELANQNY
ncbi:hypothetical protein RJ640_010168, partial [Escallonia rubra]